MESYVVCFYGDDNIKVYTTKQYKTEPLIDESWDRAINVHANSHIHAAYLAGKEDA
jgi:hypothetical protein